MSEEAVQTAEAPEEKAIEASAPPETAAVEEAPVNPEDVSYQAVEKEGTVTAILALFETAA